MTRNPPWPRSLREMRLQVGKPVVMLCDICNVSCLEAYVQLRAWYKDPYYQPYEGEAWGAEVCKQCIEKQLSPLAKSSLHVNPSLGKLTSGETLGEFLKHRRKEIYEIADVCCDICGTSCFQKHMKLEARWRQNKDEGVLRADLCEPCVEKHLATLIRFEKTFTVQTK